MPRRIALAYSGGLDTTTMVPWLKEQTGAEIVAVVADVGQDPAELDGVEERAVAGGAVACHVLDLKRSFVEDFCFPTLRTGAVYEERYLLGTAIARPVIARGQVEIARSEGCDAVAHGCTGKGNDQVRFESTFAALAPDLEILAPWRSWSMTSRRDCIDWLAERGIEIDAVADKRFSRDANLWHVSCEGAELEDPRNVPTADVWTMTVDPSDAPDAAEDVRIGFTSGSPTTVDGRELAPDILLAELNARAGRHGVGRDDLVENRLVGMKSRGCYETAGGTVLREAMIALEQLVHDRETLAFRRSLGERFAEIVYDGRWYTPVSEAVRAAADNIAAALDGVVTVRLYKGRATAISRESPRALYDEATASFEEAGGYDQADAGGFIRLRTLPSRLRAAILERDEPRAGRFVDFESVPAGDA